MRAAWNDAAAAVGLKGVALYEGTKHTLATALAEAGVTDATIAALLGHSDERSVRPYRKIRPSAVRGALAKLKD